MNGGFCLFCRVVLSGLESRTMKKKHGVDSILWICDDYWSLHRNGWVGMGRITNFEGKQQKRTAEANSSIAWKWWTLWCVPHNNIPDNSLDINKQGFYWLTGCIRPFYPHKKYENRKPPQWKSTGLLIPRSIFVLMSVWSFHLTRSVIDSSIQLQQGGTRNDGTIFIAIHMRAWYIKRAETEENG